jgi:hypothetical protein
MSTKFVKAYYNESISSTDNGHQVNIMFFYKIDDEHYFDEEFITALSIEDAEILVTDINTNGLDNFLPKK